MESSPDEEKVYEVNVRCCLVGGKKGGGGGGGRGEEREERGRTVCSDCR